MRGSDRTEKHFLHLVWSLKIEYKIRINPRQQICRGEHRSPVEGTSPQLQHGLATEKLAHRTCRGATQFLFHRNGRRPLQLWILLIRIPPLNTFIPTRKSDFRSAILHNELYNMLLKSFCDLIDIVQPYKNHINDLKWLEFCEKGAKI